MSQRCLIPALCALLAQAAWTHEDIHLKTGTFRPVARPSRLSRHFILHFDSYPGPAARDQLASRGIRVLDYIPDNAVMAVADGVPNLDGLNLTWAGNLDARSKISPELAQSGTDAYLVMFHRDVMPASGQRILDQQGLTTLANPSLLPGHFVAIGARQKLEALASRDEVAYILPASRELQSGQAVIACAGPVTEAGLVAQYVAVGQGWSKNSAGIAALNYAFTSLTPKISESAQRSEVARAFDEWARYANVEFFPGNSASLSRTVAILFASGAHADGYSFDGPGKTLAHTFYPAPPNSEPIAGDMHFDADENWQVGAGTDLFSVALHEAGHALGLGHSDNPDSVMYPYYHLVTGLTADDIAGVRALYGTGAEKSSNPPDPPDPPAPPVNPTPPDNPPPSPPSGQDVTAPSLRIALPAATVLSTSAATLAFSGTATDDTGVVQVTWSSSNGASGSASGTTNWSFSVPLLVGNNMVIVRAYDAAGNSGWRAVTVVRR